MKNFLITCLLTYVSTTCQINIQPEIELNAVVLQPFQRIYAQTNSQFLTYKFNVSILDYMSENMDLILSSCSQKVPTIEKYKFNLERKWNKTTKIEDRGTSISLFPREILKLYKKIDIPTMQICDSIEEIMIKAYKLNDKLNELAGSNF